MSRCNERESGGVRCERQAGHEGEHACPEAIAQFLADRGSWSAKRRTERDRQGLIAELARLRAVGVGEARQQNIVRQLRTDFELGWPGARTANMGGGES